MYHYMQFDPSLIRERNERMRAEMSKLRLEKRLREHHEGSGLGPATLIFRLKGALHLLRRAGLAGR
jgi:hypothetical protein